jgi:hypothetical protein
MSATSSSYTIPYNRIYVNALTSAIATGAGNQGLLLELVVFYLMRTVPGLEPFHRKLQKGGEIDIRVRNVALTGQPLRWFGDYFLVECKDTDSKVSEKEFGHFLTKLALNKTMQGAIVSKKGLAGAPKFSFASRDQKLAYAQLGITVLDITLPDLQRLQSTDDFLAMMQNKYEDLRFK